MARQRVTTDPSIKYLELYRSFSGLNTVDSDTAMADGELSDLTNIDLGERGVVRRRSGIVNHQRRAIWGDIKGKTWGEL